MQQRHANDRGSRKFFESLPAAWAMRKMPLQLFLLFCTQLSRRRERAEFEKCFVWLGFGASLVWRIVMIIAHGPGYGTAFPDICFRNLSSPR